MKYEQFLLGQIQQTTACNAVHSVEQRMCKWLVRMHDLAGNDLPLTQEFLAQTMGVGRTSVTGVASHLQSQGMISYSRGKVRILNLELIQRRACECRRTVRELYGTEFGSEGPTLPPKPDKAVDIEGLVDESENYATIPRRQLASSGLEVCGRNTLLLNTLK